MFSPKTFLSALALLTAASALQSSAEPVASYDYIIVGGGTTGLLLANRLSHNLQHQVAVIDPGADERNNTNIVNPLTWLGLSGTSVDWNYQSVPQKNLGGRVLKYDAGRGIGGTSLINGMTYIRGDAAQFDAWKSLGNSGWDWNDMFTYYRQVERFFPPRPWQETVGASYEAKYHGSLGQLSVGFNPDLLNGSFYGDAQESWAALGQTVNKDVNSGRTAGFDVWPQTLDPVENTRCDSATAYYWPVSYRPNLTLINGTVSKILWKSQHGKREASGVEYVAADGLRKVVDARYEVILSAGALRTPLILELSGVGNPKILDKFGIETVISLPGVGENMIDQPNMALSYSTNTSFPGYAPYATFVNATSLFGLDSGDLSTEMAQLIPVWARQISEEMGGAISAKAIAKHLKVQHELIFKKDVTIGEILTTASGTGVFSAYWATLPFSRGSVHITSAHVEDVNTPVINPRFLSVGFDKRVQIALGRLAATFWNTPPVSSLIVQTGDQQGSLSPDAPWAEWENFTTSTVMSNSHPLGSAAMMSRKLGGVVDSQLKVYGTNNVRVVDASVIPMQISGHLTATLYAIAERAADFILGSMSSHSSYHYAER